MEGDFVCWKMEFGSRIKIQHALSKQVWFWVASTGQQTQRIHPSCIFFGTWQAQGKFRSLKSLPALSCSATRAQRHPSSGCSCPSHDLWSGSLCLLLPLVLFAGICGASIQFLFFPLKKRNKTQEQVIFPHWSIPGDFLIKNPALQAGWTLQSYCLFVTHEIVHKNIPPVLFTHRRFINAAGTRVGSSSLSRRIWEFCLGCSVVLFINESK